MLKIKNLTKYYDERKILDSISVEIPEESIVALVGKNGIGKTTLLYILAGLLKHQGEIELFNYIKLEEDYHEYMEKVSLIANENFLYDYLTLNETIQLIKSFSVDVNKINEMYKILLEILDIEEYKDTIVKKLSLGTRQKVQIILNMVAMPKVILFDEPFVNLDKETVDRFLEYLVLYCRNEKSIIIFSTHSKDYRLQRFITHQLEIIDGGKIKFEKKEGLYE